MNTKFIFGSLIITSAFILSACGTTSQNVKNYSYGVDLSELKLDKSQTPSEVYIRPGAPSLAEYGRFIVDPVKVDYRDPKMGDLDPEQVAEMQAYFQDAIIKQLREGGYQVGTRSVENTLRISLTLSGLKVPSATANVSSVFLPVAVSVGEVTVEAQFRDALTNRLDAVVVARSQGSRLLNTTPWSTWADVTKAFDAWATGIRQAVDDAKGK